ncbi:MAG: GNAT family N-acetyltransferase [Thermoleophilia bacterium]|nr:GNAT family N-acetyltransferase [Thermoleophilia bacterium]
MEDPPTEGVPMEEPATEGVPRETPPMGGRPGADSPFALEPFALEDLDDARALWERTGMWLRPSDSPEQMALLLARCPDLQLVARDARGVLVGTAMGGWDGRRGYIYHLAVEPAWQRRGVAGALMDELEARLRAKGAMKAKLQILAGNDASRAFFAARGWLPEDDCEPWGKELVPGGAPPAHADPAAPEGLRTRKRG